MGQTEDAVVSAVSNQVKFYEIKIIFVSNMYLLNIAHRKTEM